MQGEEAEAHRLNNSVLHSTQIPSFTELARSSPPKVKQARINTDNETDDKHCRQTEYKYKI